MDSDLWRRLVNRGCLVLGMFIVLAGLAAFVMEYRGMQKLTEDTVFLLVGAVISIVVGVVLIFADSMLNRWFRDWRWWRAFKKEWGDKLDIRTVRRVHRQLKKKRQRFSRRAVAQSLMRTFQGDFKSKVDRKILAAYNMFARYPLV